MTGSNLQQYLSVGTQLERKQSVINAMRYFVRKQFKLPLHSITCKDSWVAHQRKQF